MARTLGVTALLIAISLLSSTAIQAQWFEKNGFSFIAGAEYQVISQEFYDAIIDTSSIDAIEQWVLSDDNIEEVTGKTTIQYRLQDPRKRFKISNDFELSKDKFIGRGEGEILLGNYSEYVKLNSRVEYKSSFDDSNSGSLGYTNIYSYLQGKKRLSGKLTVGARITGDIITFNGDQSIDTLLFDTLENELRLYNEYDYSIVSGLVTGEILFSEFGRSLIWEIGGVHRFVPDSAGAEYNQYLTRLSYNGFGAAGYVALESDMEYKDYAQPGNQDDYLLFGLKSRIGYSLSENFEFKINSGIDYYSYRETDVVNRNSLRLRFDVTGLRRIGDWNAGPQILLETYSEESIEDSEGTEYSEDYIQWELGGRADLLSGGRFFADVSASAGHRSYTGKDIIISSYNLVSLSAMTGITFYRQTSLTIFFDGSFEYHDLKEDNSNLFLLSISVTSRL